MTGRRSLIALAALPQFEAAGAQVVGVSADHAATLKPEEVLQAFKDSGAK